MVREKDLIDVAFVGLSSYLRENLEGQEFSDVSQVLQRAVMHENWTRDSRMHSRFRNGNKDREKGNVGLVEENVPSDDEAEVWLAEWVDTPKDKPIMCTFLKPESGKREEMRFTFDITKCDKLFDVLLQNNVIRLKDRHTIPTAE
jgi:hypothetical protein